MKKLQKYVLAESGKALVLAFCALLLIMMVGFCMQLLHEGLDVVRLHRLLPPLVAYCVPMVLPSAFLTAVIMTFGRLSADNELIAVRAAGIHLVSVVYPVLLAGLVLTVVVAFFQFELVPRARAAIETLKYQALKQILLDKASLGARRQFSFGPISIQYDNFVSGRLTNLVLLEMSGRRPRRIVTARSAAIRPHAERAELVQFELEEPNITHFEFAQYGRPVTGSAEQILLSVPVVRDQSRILSDEKHLPVADLVATRRELARRVEEQPKFVRPRQVRREKNQELHLVRLQIAEVQKDLDELGDEYRKYSEQLPRQANEVVQNSRQRIEQTREELQNLRTRMGECMQQINALRESGEMHPDYYDRLAEREKELQTLRSQIETHEQEVEELTERVARAQQQLQGWAEQAARKKEEMDVLQAQKSALGSVRDRLAESVARARDQADLMAVDIRIHKRLAQAASLLAFALLGIPMGIAAGRRSVMIAFGISFAIVLAVFYPFLIFGQIAARSGILPIAPAMWAGNAFVGLTGLATMSWVLRR